jgi:hypothetical protein
MRIAPSASALRVTVAALAIRIALIAGFAHALRSVVVDETVSIWSARLGSAGDDLLAVGSRRICGTFASVSMVVGYAAATIETWITVAGGIYGGTTIGTCVAVLTTAAE